MQKLTARDWAEWVVALTLSVVWTLLMVVLSVGVTFDHPLCTHEATLGVCEAASDTFDAGFMWAVETLKELDLSSARPSWMVSYRRVRHEEFYDKIGLRLFPGQREGVRVAFDFEAPDPALESGLVD
jgi:hypothetical protein